jgi:flap endonuclease-1
MGIKGLPTLIESIAGNAAVKIYKFKKFKGMAVAVDASLMMHQTVIAIRSKGKDMVNLKGELTSFLHGFFYKILTFLENDMIPIFVFDGKAPDIKNKTIAKRKNLASEAEEIMKTIVDEKSEEYIKQFKKTFKPTKQNYKECQKLLDLMGIPYIIAPEEADTVCAWLASRHDNNGKRYVKGVCSDDSDMLPLGSPYLFKDMLKFMNGNKSVKVISLNKALVKMNLTMDQFVDLSVLLGCDYCDTISRVGPKTAYKLIVEHGSLEKVIKNLNKKNPETVDDDNAECMVLARDYFKNALNKLDESEDFILTDDNLKLRKFQFEELMDFMCVKHNFDIIKIQNGIKRLDQCYKNMNVIRENTKQVHTILQPRSENYTFITFEDTIDFLPSDDETKPKAPIKKPFIKTPNKPITKSFNRQQSKEPYLSPGDSNDSGSSPNQKILTKKLFISRNKKRIMFVDTDSSEDSNSDEVTNKKST